MAKAKKTETVESAPTEEPKVEAAAEVKEPKKAKKAKAIKTEDTEKAPGAEVKVDTAEEKKAKFAKLLEKAGKIIPVPKVLKADEKTKELIIEYIEL